MLPHTHKKKKKKKKKKIVICKSYIIPKASSFYTPNGSIEEKLRSLGKCPNTAKKKKFQYHDKSTLILDFN